jgi:hypothetical protein
MKYFLRTLEGISQNPNYYEQEFLKKINSWVAAYGITTREAVFKWLRENRLNENLQKIIIGSIEREPGTDYYNGLTDYRRYLAELNREQDAEALALAQAAAAQNKLIEAERQKAIAEAEQELVYFDIDQRRAADEQRRREAAANLAEAEAIRDEIDARRAADEQARAERERAEAEQQLVYDDIDYRRAQDEEREREEQVKREIEEFLKEGEQMQDITLENQVIESTPNYTIIDETADSITYEDEAGNVHIEPKASAAPWLILAAAAALFLA